MKLLYIIQRHDLFPQNRCVAPCKSHDLMVGHLKAPWYLVNNLVYIFLKCLQYEKSNKMEMQWKERHILHNAVMLLVLNVNESQPSYLCFMYCACWFKKNIKLCKWKIYYFNCRRQVKWQKKKRNQRKLLLCCLSVRSNCTIFKTRPRCREASKEKKIIKRKEWRRRKRGTKISKKQ